MRSAFISTLTCALAAGIAATAQTPDDIANQINSGYARRQAGASTAPPAAHRAESAVSSWVIYHDPNQDAFSLAVPLGWTVSGGSVSYSNADARLSIRAVSPDGGIEMFVGDLNVGLYMPMNAAFNMSCRMTRQLCPGSVYPLPDGTRVVIAEYPTGEQFAAGWGPQRIGQSCSGVNRSSSRDLLEASQLIARIIGDVRVTLRAGEAQFSCEREGVPANGYVFAATELDAMPDGNNAWQVKALAGYVASRDRAPEAAALLSIMAGSLRVNPQWLAIRDAAAAVNSKILAEAQNAVSKSIHDRFQYYNTTVDRTNDNFARYQRGQALFNDPDMGPVNLPNSEHMWKLPDGTRRGTDSSRPPVPGAQEIPRIDTSTP